MIDALKARSRWTGRTYVLQPKTAGSCLLLELLETPLSTGHVDRAKSAAMKKAGWTEHWNMMDRIQGLTDGPIWSTGEHTSNAGNAGK